MSMHFKLKDYEEPPNTQMASWDSEGATLSAGKLDNLGKHTRLNKSI
jgi:hypothetical protein